MGKILGRYILREVSVPFCLSLLIFTFILFAARILKLVDLVINRGVSLIHIGKMLLFVLPSFLEVTVPMAFLLAILWGFGRLSTDREIVAFKSCGLSLRQLAGPVGVLAVVLLGCSFFLTLFVRPWSNAGLDRVFFEVAKTRVAAGLKEKTFNNEFEGLVIYAEEIEPPGTRLTGIMIADSRVSHRRDTIFARNGLIVAGEDGRLLTLRLNEGTVHSVRPADASHQTTHFSVYDIRLDTASLLSNIKEPRHSPKDMTTTELLTVLAHGPDHATPYNKALVEFHRRLALPFACVVFGIIALPLGVRTASASRSIGFGVSLAVILVYYILLSTGETFGKTGRLAPMIALWLPNIVMGGLGAYLFHRATREKPIFPFTGGITAYLPGRPAFSFLSTR